MAYVPLSAGPFVAHRVRADGHRFTVIEDRNGAPFGSIAAWTAPEQPGLIPVTAGMIFEAQAGAWFVSTLATPAEPIDPSLKGRAVFDATGRVCARFERKPGHIRFIHLPAGSLMWEKFTLRPTYRIDKAYSASRNVAHQIAPGVSSRPFKGEIGDRFANGPDGVLGLLLAAWFTNNAIIEQMRRQDANNGNMGPS